jgi:acetyl-CoA carboxylase alpha subunit
VATFLYSDANRVPELAEFLHIAAPELFERVIADQIAAEPEG